MYAVQKKSGYQEAKGLLIQAFRNNHSLIWDRYDAMQPQCGFGRLGISCTECLDGPCRINPFGDEDQAALCGRDRKDLVSNYVLQKIRAGVDALITLAADSGVDSHAVPPWGRSAADRLLGAADMPGELAAMAAWAGDAMAALAHDRPGSVAAYATKAGFGVLRGGKANVVLHGNLPSKLVKGLLDKASEVGVSLSGICGSEGYYGIPVLANYGSQELPLVSGEVDAAILGTQDVMPSFKRLAGKLGVPLLCAKDLTTTAAVDKVFAAALERSKKRPGKLVPLGVPATMLTGWNAASCATIFDELEKGRAAGSIRGFAYLGGSGNIAHTQDSDLLHMATALLQSGYLLATSGGTGTALARNGLCDPDFDFPVGLRAVLPAGVPAVLHLGASYDAALFVEMAAVCARKNIPVAALMPEVVSGKDMAIAAGLAGAGIPTYLDSELFAWLPEQLMSGLLQPLDAFTR